MVQVERGRSSSKGHSKEEGAGGHLVEALGGSSRGFEMKLGSGGQECGSGFGHS